MATDIRSTLLLEIHRIISSVSSQTVDELNPEVTAEIVSYPPKPVFTDSEIDALKTLELSTDARSALQKVIADSCAAAFFEFFSLIDAVADPEASEVDTWLGARIIAPPDDADDPMWHDDLFDSYWDYEELTNDV